VARTTRRRRRKHRGTQAGSIDRRGRAGRPQNRQEARARARRRLSQRQQDRRDQPPTWNSAAWRGLFGAGVFLVLLVALFGQPFGPALGLSVLMLAIYIPLGHLIDRFFYNRRQAAKRRERERGG
jgi:Flp pilus assembly protein TadB